MPEEANFATWTTYQKAWSDVSTAKRQNLLRRSVADAGTYTDPLVHCTGHAELLAYIEQFRASMPGASFRNHQFMEHHAQSLAAWTLYDAQGAEIQPGTSYAQFGEDGRLTHIIGFFATDFNAA